MPAWPLVVGEEGQEKELRSGNFHVLRKGEELDIDECYEGYTQLPIQDEQISVSVRKLLFSQLLPKLVWQCFEVRREDTIISILPMRKRAQKAEQHT